MQVLSALFLSVLLDSILFLRRHLRLVSSTAPRVYEVPSTPFHLSEVTVEDHRVIHVRIWASQGCDGSAERVLKSRLPG